ncbi:MAG: M20/M25/M40 family metallo-hydrolase [Coxiellaceae bacterium]|nr:M20/M25/M40 family metallo-hydrolase [Coxiellaceae bacterium]
MSKQAFNVMLTVNLQQQLNLLKKMVDIKSISTDGCANDKVNAIVAKELVSLGFKVKLVSHEHHRGLRGKLLTAELPGKLKKFVTLIGHSDTVNASDEFNDFSYEENAVYAHGPGVIDCKGGLVIMLAAVKAFLKSNPEPQFSLRLISSPAEEIGSRDFHDHLVKYGEDSNFILGFEPAFANGNVVNSRAGNRWYKLRMKGRTAHSGRDFTKGINAVAAMAIKLSQMHTFSDVNKGTTVAITHISGGKPNYNTVPEYCEAMLDTRFLTDAEDKRLEDAFQTIFQTVEVTAYSDFKPAEIKVEVADYTQPIELQNQHNHFLDVYLDAVKKFEKQTITADVSHGSADCNSLITDTNVFIGGLGAVGDGMHTIKEKVKVNSLITRAECAAQLLHYINTTLS